MIELEPHADGTLLPVRAQPGARRNAVIGEHAGMLKVAVTQVAEKGKANQAVIEVLAKALGVRKSHIELVSGTTSQEKRFVLRGIAPDALAVRIRALLTNVSPS